MTTLSKVLILLHTLTLLLPLTLNSIHTSTMLQRKLAASLDSSAEIWKSLRWLATLAVSPSLYVAITCDYIWCTELHIRLRGMLGRGGWCHPPDTHVGSIRGCIFHWTRPMTHTNRSTIPVWNNLPPHVVSSPTLDSFRQQLTHM